MKQVAITLFTVRDDVQWVTTPALARELARMLDEQGVAYCVVTRAYNYANRRETVPSRTVVWRVRADEPTAISFRALTEEDTKADPFSAVDRTDTLISVHEQLAMTDAI